MGCFISSIACHLRQQLVTHDFAGCVPKVLLKPLEFPDIMLSWIHLKYSQPMLCMAVVTSTSQATTLYMLLYSEALWQLSFRAADALPSDGTSGRRKRLLWRMVSGTPTEASRPQQG